MKLQLKFLSGICFLFLIFAITPTLVIGQEHDLKKSNTGIDFSGCAGPYLLLDGRRYYEGETALICVGARWDASANSPDYLNIEAHNADNSNFPTDCTWDGVANNNGHIANFDHNVPSTSLNNFFAVTASYFIGTAEVSVTINIIIQSIHFLENENQAYGFDPNQYGGEQWYPSYNDLYSWKSVELGSQDIFDLSVNPEAYFEDAAIESNNLAIYPVSPIVASSSLQVVTVQANQVGQDGIISALYQGENKCEGLNNHMEVHIASYNKEMGTVRFVLIAEENDDVQVIEKGFGLPNSICIGPGPNGIIDTPIPSNNDDFITGNYIATGNNGICETTAVGDDKQIIQPGNGEPNSVCTSPGYNGFRDTPDPMATIDDLIVGDYVNTGPDGICDTKAGSNNANTGYFFSFNLATGANYLNDIYRQAVYEWQSMAGVDLLVVNYDLNRDGKLTVGTSTNPSSPELNKIMDTPYYSSRNPSDSYLMFTDFGNELDGTEGILGHTVGLGSNLTFLFPGDIFSEPDPSGAFEKGIAHELGHARFGLMHVTNQFGITEDKDPANLMTSNSPALYAQKLRKYQWDEIHN